MCHPYTFISQDLVGSFEERFTNGWAGAMSLYDKLSFFIFKPMPDDNGRELSVKMLHDILYRTGRDPNAPLTKWISLVRARAVVDVATRHEAVFLRRWCSTDKDSYGKWNDLEDMCLMRENLDLFYVGSIRCKLLLVRSLCHLLVG